MYLLPLNYIMKFYFTNGVFYGKEFGVSIMSLCVENYRTVESPSFYHNEQNVKQRCIIDRTNKNYVIKLCIYMN
jgi:hypothetical protein